MLEPMRTTKESALSGSDSPLFSTSLEKGLSVLLAFSNGRRELNLPEIAQATGFTKSAAQRFAFTLERLGYLHKGPKSKRYSLTPRCLDLGYGYLRSNWLIEQANPYLQELSRRTLETVNLSVPDSLDMVFVARFPSQQHIAIHMPVGSRLPMYCTAAGRAYLSALETTESDSLLRRMELKRFTPNTEVDPAKLSKLIEEIRAAGYAWAEEEYFRGDINLGVAVRDPVGRPLAAINVSLPTSRWTLEQGRVRIAPMLIETARALATSATVN